jgi:hypothetical protein
MMIKKLPEKIIAGGILIWLMKLKNRADSDSMIIKMDTIKIPLPRNSPERLSPLTWTKLTYNTANTRISSAVRNIMDKKPLN